MRGIDIYCQGNASAEHSRVLVAELFFSDISGFEAWGIMQVRRERNVKGKRRVAPARIEGKPPALANSKIRFRCLHCGDNLEVGAGKWALMTPVLDALREAGSTELSLPSFRRAYFIACKAE